MHEIVALTKIQSEFSFFFPLPIKANTYPGHCNVCLGTCTLYLDKERP